MEQTVKKELNEFIETFVNAGDNVSKVLRLHALTENYLERMIILRLKYGEKITNDSRFSYHHKLQIANAFGIDGNLVGALRKLSSLRNECAHSRKPEITTEAILEISAPLQSKFKKALLEIEGDFPELTALAWLIFTELSIIVAPIETVFPELKVGLSK